MGYIENGNEIARKLSSEYGWTKNPIAAFLGNVQQESTINPASFQGGSGNWSQGVGLVQWTPGTNLQSRAKAIGRSDYLTIDCQLAVIDYERRTGIQYYPTSAYNISFNEFIKSEKSVDWLTMAWLKNYERAGAEESEKRIRYANEWYSRIGEVIGSGIVEKAVKWAIDIANDNSHGYDQANRWGPDYDCSSFLTSAYRNAGLKIGGGTGVYTGNMRNYFIAAGFQDVTSEVNMSSGSGVQKGDVLIKPGEHTAMSIGSGQVVQASINEHGEVTGGATGDQTGKEIWTTGYYNYPWVCVLRYPGGIAPGGGIRLVRWIPA